MSRSSCDPAAHFRVRGRHFPAPTVSTDSPGTETVDAAGHEGTSAAPQALWGRRLTWCRLDASQISNCPPGGQTRGSRRDCGSGCEVPGGLAPASPRRLLPGNTTGPVPQGTPPSPDSLAATAGSVSGFRPPSSGEAMGSRHRGGARAPFAWTGCPPGRSSNVPRPRVAGVAKRTGQPRPDRERTRLGPQGHPRQGQ